MSGASSPQSAPSTTPCPPPPVTPQPQPQPESVNPSQIIVIHAGSLHLRIGLASDTNHKCILHVIARKNKSKLVTAQEPDSYLIPAVKMDKESTQTFKDVQ